MIVSPHSSGWNIFFHRAHALLAMKIAMGLKKSYWPLPEFWAEGLSSITEHDNGQPSWNKKDHLNEGSAPLDYREDDPFDRQQVEVAVNNAKYKSSFMALMVSLHCHHLYKEIESEEIDGFLKEQETLRKSIIKHLDVSKTAVDQCYAFLRWCDELSLLLCQNALLKNQRKLEVGELPDDGMIRLYQNKDNALTFEPWCLEKEELELSVEYFQTSRFEFENDKDLKEHLAIDKPLTKRFLFRKA